MSKIAKKYGRERETSSDEDNIPLMELVKRMREQEFAEAYSPSKDQKHINEVNVQKQAYNSNVKNIQASTTADFIWSEGELKNCTLYGFFSSPSDLMKSTVVDESLTTTTTRVLFQRKISLLQETTE